MNRASIFLDSSSVITIPEHLQDAHSKTVWISIPDDRDDAIHVESAAKARALAMVLLRVAESLDGLPVVQAAREYHRTKPYTCGRCNHPQDKCDAFRASNPSEWARTHGRVIS